MINWRKNSRRSSPRAGVRARSLPYRKPFLVGALWTFGHYLCVIGLVTALAVFIIEPTPQGARLVALLVGLCGLTWLIAFFARRRAFCPLCKGTPLIASGALPHRNAVRLRPLNHGHTAVLGILACQKFRCMYCGSPFDMLKEPSHSRRVYQPDDA